MKNKKLPKTHTVFGVKCKYNKKSLSWKGENDQYRVELWDRDITYRNPNERRYLVEVVLRTFHQISIDGYGDTLKDAQHDVGTAIIRDRCQYENIEYQICKFIWKLNAKN